MKIEFGNLINDYETAETITYWYDECINTITRIFNDSKVNFSIVYKGDFEKVFLINDETFIYTGIVIRKFSGTEFNKIENRSYGNIAGFIREKSYIYTNELLICALNYSSFKGIHRSIFRNVSRNVTSNGWVGSPEIIVSYPYFSKKEEKDYNACFKYCSEKIKEYDLKRIVKEFKGAPYIVAIYKIENENHEIGYATYCFDKIDRAHQLARRCYSEYLQYCLDFTKKPYKEYLVASCPMNLKISNNFKDIFEKLYIVNGKPIADVKEVYNFISYSLIDVRDRKSVV